MAPGRDDRVVGAVASRLGCSIEDARMLVNGGIVDSAVYDITV
jgi:hypothetical protein